ncbi:MAG: RNA polymerase sigma factor RpoD/SigA [Spirochaetaceae bacterium]|jgi:RNA polymerase primary sigma factor|nr:RNA polymerase sigma factor RpoD/SigA [Spirochaetaceae bacterium]
MTEDKTNLLQIYFSQIKAYRLLSFEEELDLARRIQWGEKQCRQRLVESNLRLVVKIARSYFSPDLSLLDLIQEGNLGLIHAAELYDPAKQVRFSTYAGWWIKQSIFRFLVNKRRIIRLPQRKEEILKKIQRAYHILTQELTRKPTPKEIAGEIGVSVSDVNTVLFMTNGILSLDAEGDDPNSEGILEYHEDYTYNPERVFLRKDSKAAAMKVLNTLTKREKDILMYRYQFDGERYTLKKIGRKMGISPETVRQIEIKTLQKIQNNPALYNYSG